MRARRGLLLCLAATGAFFLVLVLAYEVHWVQLHDARLLARLYARRDTWLGDVAEVVIHLGDPGAQLLLLTALLMVAAHLGRRREAVAAGALVLGADLSTQILKVVLSHPRYQPVLGYNEVAADSFPSGHATAMAAMTYACFLALPRRWWPAGAVLVFLTVLVCISSVVLHHHFPSDVVGGVLVATAWLGAVLAAMELLAPQNGGDPRR